MSLIALIWRPDFQRTNSVAPVDSEIPLPVTPQCVYFDLQSLIGTLQFACKAVVSVRTFLQHMIDLTRGIHNHFHHICFHKEFFKDLNMWKVFLARWNGHSFFLDTTVTPSPDMHLYTDASGTIGFGNILMRNGFRAGGLPTCTLTKTEALA